MEEPKPEKVAVIDEVRERLDGSSASVVTEYRGLTVAKMAELRRSLRAAGGDFKVFKNTLVRRALEGTSHEGLQEFLVGPTAIAFVHGDISTVAKTLKDFADANPALVVKGGVFEGSALSPQAFATLANLPSRDVLLARLAGLIASPMQSLAGLMKAVPQSLAYGLQALIDSKPAAEAPATPAPVAEEAPAEAVAPVAEKAEATADAPETAEETSEVVAEQPVSEEETSEVVAQAPSEEAETKEAPSEDVGEAPADEA